MHEKALKGTLQLRPAEPGVPAATEPEATRLAAAGGVPVAAPTPAGAERRELTWQAVIGAILISALVAFSYPYIVLKLGLGPDVSLLSAFLGALFLYGAARKTRGRNGLMNNVIQTAGTSASQTAFMCVVAAAFVYLNENRSVNVHVELSSWQIFTWLICSGAIGVLFIPLFRRYFLDDPKLVFPDGVAAAETITTLDTTDQGATDRLKVLGGATAIGAASSLADDGFSLIKPTYFAERFSVGIDWNLLSVGMGVLIGLRVSLSFVVGTILIFLFGDFLIDRVGLEIVNSNIAPADVAQCDALRGADALSADQQAFLADRCGPLGSLMAGNDFGIVLLWTMWPATALLVASALTAVALRWRGILQMFRGMFSRRRAAPSDDVPVWFSLGGAALLAVLLAWVQNVHFGLSYVETFLAVIVELPLMLIGVRVLGETNFGPVSVMANATQVVFAIFFRQQVAHNLIAAGMAGDGNSQAEGTIQDFRAGQIVGSSPKILTIVQLCSIPMGAAAVAIMFPLLLDKYGIGPNGLTAPTGLKFANMAVLLSRGIGALPSGALAAIAIAAALGVLIAVLEDRTNWRWLPAPAGLAFGLILPGLLTILVAVGGIIGWLWQRRWPQAYEKYHFALAAGLISGDAIISGLLLPALSAFGVNLPTL